VYVRWLVGGGLSLSHVRSLSDFHSQPPLVVSPLFPFGLTPPVATSSNVSGSSLDI